jgi:diguanylate cyclase (GGDEF)-like protein/PAS domain S-box-containing protein
MGRPLAAGVVARTAAALAVLGGVVVGGAAALSARSAAHRWAVAAAATATVVTGVMAWILIRFRASFVTLAQSEVRFRSMVQNTSDVIVVYDEDAVTTYVSPAVNRVLGYDPADLAGRHGFDMVHDEDAAGVRASFSAVIADPAHSSVVEFRAHHRDGGWRWIEATISNLLTEPAVGGILATLRETTDRRRLERRLRHQALHDPLTGLPNRALFRDRVEHALARMDQSSGALSVLFIDLDGFKTLNDSLGHDAGDAVLIEVGERFRTCLRQSDTVARLGGDEFAILVAGSVREATLVATRILRTMRDPFVVRDKEMVIGASVGITASTGQGVVDELLRDADLAMYTAKARGKDTFEVFQPAMHADALERLELESDLRVAVEREELRVFYQPIVAISSQRIVGFEALVRWQHPRRGLVSPERFVPLAEETGLIAAVGEWVLRTALEHAGAWPVAPSGPPLVLHVNVSAPELRRPYFAETLLERVRRSSVDPRRIVLEITETALMDDVESTAGVLRSLRDAGLRTAIDDFGTGYSSLSRLASLPVDILKIDKSFVGRLVSDPERAALTGAVVHLGRVLGLDLVAEGVESVHQLQRLEALGVDLVQGYALRGPLDAEAVADLLASGREASLVSART